MKMNKLTKEELIELDRLIRKASHTVEVPVDWFDDLVNESEILTEDEKFKIVFNDIREV
jgi:hypothetical protein